jgi:multidrug efflux pump subunit AcrA (membrane-fusion protein)
MRRIYLLGFLSFLLSSACSKVSKTAAKEEEKHAVVFLEKAEERQDSDFLDLPGLLLSQTNASLKAGLSGSVTQIFKSVGAKVKAGEPLLEIRHSDAAFDYRPYLLRASFAGRLSELLVAPGSSVTEGDVVARVIDDAKLEVHVQVPARDLERMKELRTVALQNDPKVLLKVAQLAPLVSLDTGTALAVLRFQSSQAPAGLNLGTLLTLRLNFSPSAALWVSSESLVYRKEKVFVRILQEGKIQWKEIKIGKQLADKVEVTEGLVKDEEIVMRASRYVGEGEIVKVFEEPAEKSDSALAR